MTGTIIGPLQVGAPVDCEGCKLHRLAVEVGVNGEGSTKASIVVVSKMANSSSYQTQLEEDLASVGIDISDVYFTQALRCKNFEQSASNADVKACKPYLEEELGKLKPDFVLALGNEALLATTGRSGITKYRAKVFELAGAKVVPTISPSSVARNPGQRKGYMADLRFFANQVAGRTSGVKIPKYHIIDTPKKLKWLIKTLKNCHTLSYDVETFSEDWRPDGKIISLSGSCLIETRDGLKFMGFALPLYHPESPFQKTWKSVLKHLAPAVENIPRVIAHNGKYDEKWMTRFGCPIRVTFDTMLAIHLLNENEQKALKPNAQARLGVDPWGVDTSKLLQMTLEEVLEYNFLDTYYTYLLKKLLLEDLKKQPRLLRVFQFLLMPANADLVQSELRGIWIDLDLLHERKPVIEAELERIEGEILGHIQESPEDPMSAWPRDARGRPLQPNFNASNFARWFLFDYLGLPVLERGKEKADGSIGAPSMREGVLMELKAQHPAVSLMLERVKWQKYSSSFINAYLELYDEDHRIHTNFKLAGTVTGRLSSGKADEEKVSAQRGRKLRGVNLQQVPRDPLIRGLFGAPPGWSFIEADYSQVELRIAAFLAREKTMLRLYQQGADIHLATAARVTGLPESQVTGEVRKKVGKPVNFGFLYGMGWRKFIQTAFENYGAHFSEAEARAAREAYFQLFPELLPWHNRQRRLVNQYGRVQSPLGRVRHLPDIFSPDPGVRAEAERQAINSPVQGFASDMALLAMTIINARFREQSLAAHCIGLVHDAINFEIRDDHVGFALPIIKDTMEDVEPLRRKFGVDVDVPIIADLKVGRYWGGAKEISPEQVYNW